MEKRESLFLFVIKKMFFSIGAVPRLRGRAKYFQEQVCTNILSMGRLLTLAGLKLNLFSLWYSRPWQWWSTSWWVPSFVTFIPLLLFLLLSTTFLWPVLLSLQFFCSYSFFISFFFLYFSVQTLPLVFRQVKTSLLAAISFILIKILLIEIPYTNWEIKVWGRDSCRNK